MKQPFVIGAVIDLGLCLDLATSGSLDWLKVAYASLREKTEQAGAKLPHNEAQLLRRNLDCAVIRYLHAIRATVGLPSIDTVKGIFIEGKPIYPGAGFHSKTHVQIAVRNLRCIKGVFRVPSHHLN